MLSLSHGPHLVYCNDVRLHVVDMTMTFSIFRHCWTCPHPPCRWLHRALLINAFETHIQMCHCIFVTSPRLSLQRLECTQQSLKALQKKKGEFFIKYECLNISYKQIKKNHAMCSFLLREKNNRYRNLGHIPPARRKASMASEKTTPARRLAKKRNIPFMKEMPANDRKNAAAAAFTFSSRRLAAHASGS
jgi:hypothetical protein